MVNQLNNLITLVYKLCLCVMSAERVQIRASVAFAPLKTAPHGKPRGAFTFWSSKCAQAAHAPLAPNHCGRDALATLFGWTLVSVSQLNALSSQITTLITQVTTMSAELDALSSNVDKLIAAAEAETTLLTSVKAALDTAIAAGNDGAQLQALSDKLAAEVDKVNAAIAANSPPPAA